MWVRNWSANCAAGCASRELQHANGEGRTKPPAYEASTEGIVIPKKNFRRKCYQSRANRAQRLAFAKEFHRRRPRQQSGLGSLLDEIYHGFLAALAITHRPFVHIHADELVGEFRFHVARELHRIRKRLFT